MNRFFSKNLYKEALIQLRLSGFLMGGALLAISLLIPTMARLGITATDFAGMARETFMAISVPLSLYLFFAPVLLGISAFGFLDSRKKSDFYHALPVNRTTLFGSFSAAILTWLIATATITILASALLFAILGGIVAFKEVPLMLITVLPGLLYGAVVVMLVMAVTGTVFTNIVVSYVALWLPALLNSIFRAGVAAATPSIPSSEVGLFGLHVGNLYYWNWASLFDDTASYSGAELALSILFTVILTVLIYAAAMWLFSRRKSEMAESSAPSSKLQMLYMVAVALPPLVCFSLVNGFVGQGYLSTGLVLSVPSLIAVCSFELITTRKWRNLLKALVAFGIAVMIALLFTTLVWGVAKYENSFTPAASEIESIRVLDSQNDLEYREEKELIPLRQLSKSRTRMTCSSAREELAKELKEESTKSPTWGANFDYWYDEGYLDDSYPIDTVVEIRLTDGSVKRRIVPVALETYEPYDESSSDDVWEEETSGQITLTPLGKALVACSQK